MADTPWSGKPEQFTKISDLQQLMMFDPTGVIGQKNKRISLLNSRLQKIPQRVIRATSQSELEASILGTNLQVPDNTGITVFMDESFPLLKPFSIGLNSALRFQSEVSRTEIDVSGITGPIFKNTNPSNLIGSLQLRDIIFKGNDANTEFLDVHGTFLNSLLLMSQVIIEDFKSLGYSNMGINNISELLPRNVQHGIFFENFLAVIMQKCAITQTNTHNMTFVSMATNLPATINLDIFNGFSFNNTDTMFYLSKLIPTTANISVKNAVLDSLAQLFQQGATIPVSITGAGASPTDSKATITAHSLVVGQIVDLKDFTLSGHNGSFRVTVIDDNNTVDIGMAFEGVDTGNMVSESLDHRAVQVFADQNSGFPKSMTQAEIRTNPTINMTPTSGSFSQIESDAPEVDDFIKDPGTRRFSLDTFTGVHTYDGINPIDSADIIFEVRIQKTTGGSSATATVSVFINGVQQVKTDRTSTPYTTTTPGGIAYTGGFFTLNPGDTIELRMDATSLDPVNVTYKIITRE